MEESVKISLYLAGDEMPLQQITSILKIERLENPRDYLTI